MFSFWYYTDIRVRYEAAAETGIRVLCLGACPFGDACVCVCVCVRACVWCVRQGVFFALSSLGCQIDRHECEMMMRFPSHLLKPRDLVEDHWHGHADGVFLVKPKHRRRPLFTVFTLALVLRLCPKRLLRMFSAVPRGPQAGQTLAKVLSTRPSTPNQGRDSGRREGRRGGPPRPREVPSTTTPFRSLISMTHPSLMLPQYITRKVRHPRRATVPITRVGSRSLVKGVSC